MNRTIFVVGTDHGYQTRSAAFTDMQHDAFAHFVANTCRTRGIGGIAEECSTEAFSEPGAKQPVLEHIARSLGLQHRYCDPDRQTRSQLGIQQENDIRAFARSKLSEAEVQEQVQASHRTRERYWLQQLLEFNVWPVLYVCGANHSMSLLSLLGEHNVHAELIAADWCA